jgi:hypothetical protein
MATAAVTAVAQGQQPVVAANDPIAATTPLPQGELDALLAPIALYPDQLLAQILMASTYPLEIVMAGRFMQQNPSLVGDALDQALGDKQWDPSVLSLTAYPQVLLMMNDKLDWTQRLGDAFLANQQQVMDTVQVLRGRAQAAGNLSNTPQQTVANQDGFIDIEPAQPQFVYVPVYDPRVIYGPWSDPVYQPDYWYPPAIYGYPDISAGIAVGIFFGAAWGISSNHWGWARPNWRGHGIDMNFRNNNFAQRPQFVNRWRDGQWAHQPEHRHGVAYRDNGTQARFNRSNAAAIQAREPFRGRDLGQPQQAGARQAPRSQQGMAAPTPQQQSFVRPAPATSQTISRPAPQLQQYSRPMPQRSASQPAYFPQPRAQVQMDSNRGQMSRQTNGAQSAPQRGRR